MSNPERIFISRNRIYNINSPAAPYEYDPYGNILSVNTYNNDNIGNINPIRYKDYYYDAQTGWYQTGSRFYDPETGRFLNADDVSLITETDSGVVDKNLYAYCDGNPVMRKDDDGEFWNIIAGAAIGAAFEVGNQMIVEGKSFKEIDKGQVLKAAAQGALSAAGPVGVLISAGWTGTSSYKNNHSLKKAITDGVVQAGLDYVCGNGGMKIASKLGHSKVGISAVQKHVKVAKRYSEKLSHKVFNMFHSSLSYFVYNGASYHYSRRHSHR